MINQFQNRKFGLIQIINMNTSSFRSLSILEPLPYPTVQQLPSHICILNLETMDQKLSTLNLDIYSMNMLALEIKQSLMYLDCKLEYFSRCGIRLLLLIDCIFYHFGIDYYHLSKLVGYIRYCNGKWKKHLLKAITQINYHPKVETVFFYKTQRNLYLFSMLRTNNTVICKMIERLISRGILNTQNKRYLFSKGIGKIYQVVNEKMLQILQEKEEQTYFKIHLINEFLRFLILYIKLCITTQEEEIVFKHFLVSVTYLCRILRKFYCIKIMKDVELSLIIIKQGFQTFIHMFQRRGIGFTIKVEQIKLIIRLIDRRYHFQPTKLTNQNAFIISLLQNILNNWRKYPLKQQKERKKKGKIHSKELIETKILKNQQSHNKVYNRLNIRKKSTLELQMIQMNKSLSYLNRRKSVKKNQFSQNFGKQLSFPNSVESTSNIQIKREIKHGLDHYFQKVNRKNHSKTFSKDRKRVMSCKQERGEEKQLKLQDYTNYFNSKVKVIPNSNKIQLYQADKMANYYRAKPEMKLKLNS